MTTKATNIPLDATRVGDIANAIRNACAPIFDADQSKAEARELAKNLGEQALGVRETIMARVAKLSCEGGWDAREVTAAAKAAASMGNDMSDKSLATFIGQVKLAAMPLVRDRFVEITTIVETAWQAEADQLALDASSPAPIRKAWKRRFHTLVHFCKVVADNSRTLPDADALVAYAHECDPDHDEDKIEAKIATFVKNINAMHVDFPHEDLRVVAEYLAGIDAKSLKKARDTMLAERVMAFGAGRIENAGPTGPANTTTVVSVSKPGKLTTVKTSGVVNAPAAPTAPVGVDLVDDLLGDNLIQNQKAA